MSRKLSLTLLVAVLAMLIAVPVYALPGKPDFGEHIYADGEAWGTKVTAVFKEPKGNSGARSFDALYVITNDNNPETQLPVGEAAPGNPMYSGGRWWLHTATWIEDLPHPKPVLTSYDEVMLHAGLGHLIIADAQVYFQCPLLPVK